MSENGSNRRTRYLCVSALLGVGATFAVGAEVVPFDSPRWKIQAKESRIEEHLGRPSHYLDNGMAWLEDVVLQDGIVEFDIAFTPDRGFAGPMFRIQDSNSYEHFYLRPHQSGQPYANQYWGILAELSMAELIDRHTEVRGGQQAIEAAQSLEIDLHIAEPSFEVGGLYRADHRERMCIDIFAGAERVFSEGFNGSAGWQWKGGEEHAESIAGEKAAALRHGAIFNLRGLHELQALGHGVSYLGLEDLDGVEFHTIEITLDDGFKRYDYLDLDSFLIVRSRSFRAFHPDLDPEKKWHETRFSDFRDVEGQIRAFTQHTVDLATGETISTVTNEAIRVNVTLAAELFEVP